MRNLKTILLVAVIILMVGLVMAASTSQYGLDNHGEDTIHDLPSDDSIFVYRFE